MRAFLSQHCTISSILRPGEIRSSPDWFDKIRTVTDKNTRLCVSRPRQTTLLGSKGRQVGNRKHHFLFHGLPRTRNVYLLTGSTKRRHQKGFRDWPKKLQLTLSSTFRSLCHWQAFLFKISWPHAYFNIARRLILGFLYLSLLNLSKLESRNTREKRAVCSQFRSREKEKKKVELYLLHRDGYNWPVNNLKANELETFSANEKRLEILNSLNFPPKNSENSMFWPKLVYLWGRQQQSSWYMLNNFFCHLINAETTSKVVFPIFFREKKDIDPKKHLEITP